MWLLVKDARSGIFPSRDLTDRLSAAQQDRVASHVVVRVSMDFKRVSFVDSSGLSTEENIGEVPPQPEHPPSDVTLPVTRHDRHEEEP